VEQARRTTS